tara:strand:+ start:1229 stop:1405 length:177 start_codon:yes stop_codon:yes gene_type:complete
VNKDANHSDQPREEEEEDGSTQAPKVTSETSASAPITSEAQQPRAPSSPQSQGWPHLS